MYKWKVWAVAVLLSILGLFGSMLTVAFADSDLNSAHYHLDEGVVGGGGLIQSNSSNFQSTESLSDTAVGNSASTNFQIDSGSKTTADPALSFGINNGNANFGTFTTAAAATATSTFQVSDYTSYGYVVQIVGSSPVNGSHSLATMSSTGPSQAGTEQFGINLVANTSPANFGANPDHGQFGFGSATANYGTPNVYRYVSGETIASAPKSSGITTYTISYIVNVTSVTPGGQYASDQTLVCTGTY